MLLLLHQVAGSPAMFFFGVSLRGMRVEIAYIVYDVMMLTIL
jgi:hypothetical protein